MNKLAYLILTVLLWATCGFNWGFGSKDKCNDAKKLAASLAGLTGESREKQEERILKTCPDGAAGHYIKGLRLERAGKPDAAIEEFRSAVESDDSLAEAHGELGLLLLTKGEHGEAGVELSKGLLGRNDPRYHLGLAQLLRDGKMYALALFHYKEALRAFPDDVSVHLGLAQTYYGLNRFNEAEQEFSHVLELSPASGEALIGLAWVYRKKNRLDDAITELKKAELVDSRQPGIHKLLAEAYLEKGEPALAENEYRLAGIRRDADDPDDLIHKGDEYLLARNFDKAVEEYQKALRKRPGWPKALEKLGDAYMAAGSDDEAIASYRKVTRDDPSNSSVHYSLGVLLERKGALDQAVAEYRESLRLDPKNGDTHRRLADIYMLRGGYPEAAAEYEKLISMRSDNPLLHYKLAKVYEAERNYKRAIGEYRAAVTLDPDNIATRKELAALCRRRGMARDAEREYREILHLKKDDLDARNALMAILISERKYDDLFSLVKEGAELFPRDPASHYKLGIVYDFRKDYDNAIAQFQEAIALKGDYAKALSALGKTYMKTGAIEKAKVALEEAKKADPSLTEPRELLSSISEEPAPAARHAKKGHHRAHGKRKAAKRNSKAKKKRKK